MVRANCGKRAGAFTHQALCRLLGGDRARVRVRVGREVKPAVVSAYGECCKGRVASGRFHSACVPASLSRASTSSTHVSPHTAPASPPSATAFPVFALSAGQLVAATQPGDVRANSIMFAISALRRYCRCEPLCARAHALAAELTCGCGLRLLSHRPGGRWGSAAL